MRSQTTLAAILVMTLLPLHTGCVVRKSTHEATLDQLARERAEREAQVAQLEDQLGELEATRQSQVGELMAEIGRLEDSLTSTEEQRARAQAFFEEARSEVYRLETILEARGAEARQLQSRLRALSAVEQEIRERNEIYEEVIGRFRSLIDAGRLSVSIARGRMVINLPQDVLFQSGSADLAPEGRQTLEEVGGVLAELTDRSFQVEGHTDTVPISTDRFPSNWELSAGRALSVVHLLVRGGVSATSLSGAAYGEFQPVADNDTPAGRRLNRRIEIVMLPNLDVIADAAITG
jgi:chemotaxis protein MotB